MGIGERIRLVEVIIHNWQHRPVAGIECLSIEYHPTIDEVVATMSELQHARWVLEQEFGKCPK